MSTHKRDESLTIIDNRTGQELQVPIQNGTIDATAFRQLKADDNDFGLMVYDPAFKNTAACRSAITFIDGERGILRYRGYPIEELAEKCDFLQVAYLLFKGELPSEAEYQDFKQRVMEEMERVPGELTAVVDAMPASAHPMTMMISLISALSAFYPDAKDVTNAEVRERQIVRLLGQVPVLAGWVYRRMRGAPRALMDPTFSYEDNFVRMTVGGVSTPAVYADAIRLLFILHADHEQNCSTTTMRVVGSSHADPFSAVAAATAALYGPLHGGANEAVLKMLTEIGRVENIPVIIESVKRKERRLMGMGHRVYKNYDPRAQIIREMAHRVFTSTGMKNPRIELAVALEKAALADEYFVSKKLYPNVDFYSGLIYEAMGYPTSYFTVLFLVPRVVGWLAQWNEMMEEGQPIARPRQVYVGPEGRSIE